MEEQLARLEDRVLQAIGLIQELRQENAGLKERCSELEDEKTRLDRQLAEAREAAASAGQFEVRRQQIERKVSDLLEKLEAMG